MSRKINWTTHAGTLLVVAITLTLLLVTVATGESGKGIATVNINTADSVELSSLPGIGSAKAAAIVEYRTEHGHFTTVDDLTKVQGIGKKVLNKIRDLIRTQ